MFKRIGTLVMVSQLGVACGDPPKPTVPAPNITQSSDDAGPLECFDALPEICQQEYQVVLATNRFRADNGQLEPLTYDGRAAFVARDWSQQMANAGTLSHDGFPLERIKLYARRFPDQPEFKVRGENVLLGNYQTTDRNSIAQIMVNQWAASPAHREQMLQNYTTLGVGVVQRDGIWYATQLFTE